MDRYGYGPDADEVSQDDEVNNDELEMFTMVGMTIISEEDLYNFEKDENEDDEAARFLQV
jgi:hypothetical protein